MDHLDLGLSEENRSTTKLKWTEKTQVLFCVNEFNLLAVKEILKKTLDKCKRYNEKQKIQ